MNPEFWNDTINSGEILKKINAVKNKIENFKKIKNNIQYIIELDELVYEEINKLDNGSELIKSNFIIDNAQELIKKDSDLYNEIREVFNQTLEIENELE